MQTPGEKLHHLKRDDSLMRYHNLMETFRWAAINILAGVAIGASVGSSLLFVIWCWTYHKTTLILNRAIANTDKGRVWAKVRTDPVGDKYFEPMDRGDKIVENWIAALRTVPAVAIAISYRVLKSLWPMLLS